MSAKTTLLIAILAVSASILPAQTTTKMAKIERIMELTNARTTVDQLFAQFKAMGVPKPSAEMSPEQQAKAQEMHGKIIDLVQKAMNWEKMRPEYVKMYDQTFSEGEIDGMLAFYESSVGRAMIQKMPVLIMKSMEMAQSRMQELAPEIERLTKEAARGESLPQ